MSKDFKQYHPKPRVFDDYNKDLPIQQALGSKRIKSDFKNIVLFSTGTSAPTTRPSKIGYIYIDTTAGKVYVSTGTASSADWKILN